MIHIVTSLRTNEGFIIQIKVKSAQTEYLRGVLKLGTNENRTNENRTNQGPGVPISDQIQRKFSYVLKWGQLEHMKNQESWKFKCHF